MTKKQRKASRNANKMALRSIANGSDVEIGNRLYKGRPAVYYFNPVLQKTLKVQKGIPYIRVTY